VGAACGTYGKGEKLCRILAWDIEVDYLEDRCRWEDDAEIPSYNKSQQATQFLRFIR
jgi:hypothetical protein